MIQVNALSKTYTTTRVKSLDRVTMQIKKGTVLGLIGTNGAGKSTLLRILSGIYRHDSGDCRIDDQPVFENTALKERISYISDEQYYIPSATLLDMAKLYERFKPGFSKERFLSLTELFSLQTNRSVSTFSKGMRRQGEVILALASNPDYMFCDETFDGLDPLTREMAKKQIANDVAQRNTTVILSSHNLRELEDICDHIALIHDGRLLLNKNLDDVKGNVNKYQLILEQKQNFSLPEEIRASQVENSGKLIRFVAEGDAAAIEEKLRDTAAGQNNRLLYLESLPLSLEEIFSFEITKNGYTTIVHGGEVIEK